MLSKLTSHLSENFSFLRDKKLLLAVSGGIDSMVLLHLFKSLNYDITVAHCNFGLRSEESNGDEKFVKEYAEKSDVKIFVTRFNTKDFAADNKLSVQVAARQLRYIWFHQLLEENNLDYILTAHHLDDSIETALINFTRGTGIEGLTGIPEQNDRIIRPLLNFTRQEIEAFAANQKIEWREDSSNASDKYLRNKLRHDVIPILKLLNPAFAESFKQTSAHLKQVQSLAEDASVLVYKQVVNEQDAQKRFNIQELKRLPNYKAYLYQLLKPFGFTAWDDIYSLINAQAGKQILSENFRLVKDRDVLILEPLSGDSKKIYTIADAAQEVNEPLRLRFTSVDEIAKNGTKKVIYVNNQLIKFPLFVRKWEEGDYFYPFGMNEQKKKLSKFFKDEKMSLPDKESAWVLTSEEQIIWVIGMRADDRFKVTENTTQILKIEVL